MIHEITGISRESNPYEVVQTLIETKHLDPVGLLNFIWTPGAQNEIPGYNNTRFKPYASSLILIGTPQANLLLQDARYGCQRLQAISQPARDAPFALKFNPKCEYSPIRTMCKIHTLAHRARFPGGSHIHGVTTEDTIKTTYQLSSPNRTPTTSTASSVTNTTSESQLERLTNNESNILALKNMFTNFTQRISNLEIDRAAQQQQITESLNKTREQERALSDIKAMVTDNKKDNAQMMSKLDLLLSQMKSNSPKGKHQDLKEC